MWRNDVGPMMLRRQKNAARGILEIANSPLGFSILMLGAYTAKGVGLICCVAIEETVLKIAVLPQIGLSA